MLFVINGQAMDGAPLGYPASMLQQFPAALPGAFPVSPADGRGEQSGHPTQEIYRKGKFLPEEDERLRRLVYIYGPKWPLIASEMPGRNWSQCRNRWRYYLNPALNLNKGPWTPEEDDLLEEKHEEFGDQWAKISRFFQGRTAPNVQNRYHVLKHRKEKGESLPQEVHRKKEHFTPEEDERLRRLVYIYGPKWPLIASEMPGRNRKQCRERWCNYLNPNLNKNPWTPEEDDLLKEKHEEFGDQWNKIALSFPGRTALNVQTRYHLLKRRKEKGEPSQLEVSGGNLDFGDWTTEDF